MEPVQVVELPDRHPVPGDAVQRPAAVGRGRVHGQHQAGEQQHQRDAAEGGPEEGLERFDVERPVGGGGVRRARHAAQPEREEHVDQQRERRRRAQRQRGVPLGVVVLGREAGADLDAVCGPAHDEQPHDRDGDAAVPGHVGVDDVGAVPVARQVGHDHEHGQGDHQQDPGHVGHHQRRPDAEDVEQPHHDDEPDADQLREPDVDRSGAEVARRGATQLRVREPLGGDQAADQVAEDRQHDRPPDPVAERRDRAEQREIAPPSLVGVQRDAAGLVGEHRGRLGVDPVLQQADGGGDPPQDHRAERADAPEREPERAEQESRVAQGDDEPVIPGHRLEQVAFLDDRLSHATPPSLLPPGGGVVGGIARLPRTPQR